MRIDWVPDNFKREHCDLQESGALSQYNGLFAHQYTSVNCQADISTALRTNFSTLRLLYDVHSQIFPDILADSHRSDTPITFPNAAELRHQKRQAIFQHESCM